MRGFFKVLLGLSITLTTFNAFADKLGEFASSPYKVWKQSSTDDKAQIQEGFERLAQESVWSREQAEALVALTSENPDFSGDEVLEALDQDIINWFYGLSEDRDDLVHKVARLSKTPDEATCRQFALCVVVSIANQRLYTYLNGNPLNGVHDNPVSTARAGKVTPKGIFTVEEIAGKDRRSGRYKGAYMGYAMQFMGNYFIHATSTDNYSKLGGRASAGCVRLKLDVAEKLNRTMRNVGRSNIRVVVK